MSIWDICIRRPVFTTMLVLGPVVLGLASYMRLGVELFPNVDVPVVVVTTTREGVSTVVIGFKLERNGDIAAQDVRDRVSTLLPRLPYGTDPPIVEKFNLDAAPVVTVVVSAGPGRKRRKETETAKKKIKKALKAVTGSGPLFWSAASSAR